MSHNQLGLPHPRLWDWAFRPFVYIAGSRALALGLAAMAAAAGLGYLGRAHFDGALDLHTGVAAPAWVYLAEVLVDWLAVAVVLFGLGRLVSRPFRAVDLFGTQALARWPTVLMAAATLLPGYQAANEALLGWAQQHPNPLSMPPLTPGEWGVLAVVGAAILAGLVWVVALMLQSYRICTNLSGARLAVSFIAGLLLAEVLSKLALLPILGGVMAG